MPQKNTRSAPTPMIKKNQPADWIFIFKFNGKSFPGGDRGSSKTGIFGGTFKDYDGEYSQQYVFASDKAPKLKKGKGAIGTSLNDPLGATFDQIYNGDYNYVVWNDQFYDAPLPTRPSPWGHSKGVIAWNDAGEGMVLQVSTPSWPGSGNHLHPRTKDGNTLGTIKDNDIKVSQHFFALKLSKKDVVATLAGLKNASVATDTSKPQLVKNGGPDDIQAIVKTLGKKSDSKKPILTKLSSGIKLISKPSALHVPPWQLVSAQVGKVPLRVASWWADPAIYSTEHHTHISCWANRIGEPNQVQIATTGKWKGVELGLTGGDGTQYNHAKLGVSMDAKKPLSIFGDMNQQGAIYPGSAYPRQRCSSSQNGRGGTFYVVENEILWKSMSDLLKGESAPLEKPEEETAS